MHRRGSISEWVILIKKLLKIAEPLCKSGYGEYLVKIIRKIVKKLSELSENNRKD